MKTLIILALLVTACAPSTYTPGTIKPCTKDHCPRHGDGTQPN